MPSLDEAYDSDGGDTSRRVLAGLALVGVGALAVVVAVAVLAVGGDTVTAKASAGTAAGLGIPTMLLGVVVVLPAAARTRLGVVAGSVLAVGGVVLFRHAYPTRWTRTADPLAFETAVVYGFGCAVALWFVFVAIASFRRRNSPQGTVHLELVRQGETRTIEVSRDRYRKLVGDGGDAENLIRELDER